jgi:DNA-binding MarR family transcriptional regulator
VIDQITSPHKIREILFSIRKLVQTEEGYNKRLEKNFGISASQFLCILAIYESGPLPPSQIAKHILVNSSSLTRLIDCLERKNLVERSRVSDDRRVVTISLTEGGRTLVKKAATDMNQEFMIVLRQLNNNEVERIIRAVKGLEDLISSQNLKIENATAS